LTIVAPPGPSHQDELQALIEEARQRARRRRRARTLIAAVVLLVAAGMYTLISQAAHMRVSGAGAHVPAVARTRTAQTTRLVAPRYVWFLNQTVGWVEDEYGQRLLMTTDGGRSWGNVSPPELGRPRRVTQRSLAGVFFLSRSNFWAAVFDDASTGRAPVELLHTTDGGRDWTDVQSFPFDYGQVWIDFLNQRRGWVMVDQGATMNVDPVTIYGTDSGGARWTELASGGGPMWTGTPGAPTSGCDKSGISFSNATSGWITGDCNGRVVMAHTLDGGARWRSLLLTPARPTLYGGYTLPPRFFGSKDGAFTAVFGTRHGYRASIYTTTNAGINWTVRALPGRPPAEQLYIVSPTVWIAHSQHTLYTTTDAGASWRSLRSAITAIWGFSGSWDFITAPDGWGITGTGPTTSLWHTTTGGRHWTSVQ
jgi:photosystem II stability/assembly factor-like uncharacterized protein